MALDGAGGMSKYGVLAPYLAMMNLGQSAGGIAGGMQGKQQQGGGGKDLMSILMPLLLAQGGKVGGMESQIGSSGGMATNPMYNWMI